MKNGNKKGEKLYTWTTRANPGGKTRGRATARTRGFAIQGGIGFYQVIQSVLTCVDKIV